MRNGEIVPIKGAWSDEANAWVSDVLCLTGDCWLEVTLGDKGRLVIKKAECLDGPWPKALVSNWSGPDFRVRLYGSTKYRYVRVYLTAVPKRIEFASTSGHAVRLQRCCSTG